MSSYYSDYSDEDDVRVHVTRRGGGRRPSPPAPYNYVEPPRQRPVSYYPAEQQRPSFLMPERTVIRTRSRSRERFRRPSPPTSPPVPAPAPAPVIINNRIYNDLSSDDDDHRQLQVAAPVRRDRARSRGEGNFMTREEYELERTRQQLEEMRLAAQARDSDGRHVRDSRNVHELETAKRELEEIRSREQRAKEEDRIRREMELKRLKEEEREAEEEDRRKKEAKAAVERFKQEEMERQAKEKEERDRQEKEYQRRLQEQLIKSGLDEKAIEAIIKNEKVPEPPKKEKTKEKEIAPVGTELARATWTRMPRRHLSIETLRVYHIDFEYDNDPDYIIVKRAVPNWEQDSLWKHTYELRMQRQASQNLYVDVHDHKRRSKDPQFEWVREKKSHSRKRSKSPAPLLMYLAGARPA